MFGDFFLSLLISPFRTCFYLFILKICSDSFQSQPQSTSNYNVDLSHQAVIDVPSETSSKASKTSGKILLVLHLFCLNALRSCFLISIAVKR